MCLLLLFPVYSHLSFIFIGMVQHCVRFQSDRNFKCYRDKSQLWSLDLNFLNFVVAVGQEGGSDPRFSFGFMSLYTKHTDHTAACLLYALA